MDKDDVHPFRLCQRTGQYPLRSSAVTGSKYLQRSGYPQRFDFSARSVLAGEVGMLGQIGL